MEWLSAQGRSRLERGPAHVNIEEKLRYLLEIFDKLNVQVRLDRLGGEGGGCCRLRGKTLVFMDMDADPETRYASAIGTLSSCGDLESLYLLPEVRADIERMTA